MIPTRCQQNRGKIPRASAARVPHCEQLGCKSPTEACMASEVLVISSRFCGPPKSGNGGYVCGRVATHVPGVAAVRLKAPPPLETELRIDASESRAQLIQGSNVIAEANVANLDLTPPAAPSFSEAEEAAKSYTGFTRHVFP